MNAVNQTSNCVNSSTLKRKSALAQLVAIYAERGVTSIEELVELTGYSERQIWRAKADTRVTDARVSKTDTRVSKSTDARVSPSRARIESTLRVDTYNSKKLKKENKKERESAPPKKILPEDSHPLIPRLALILKKTPEGAAEFLAEQIELHGWGRVRNIYAQFSTRYSAGEPMSGRVWCWIADDLAKKYKPALVGY